MSFQLRWAKKYEHFHALDVHFQSRFVGNPHQLSIEEGKLLHLKPVVCIILNF
jgi:hypothetical protein